MTKAHFDTSAMFDFLSIPLTFGHTSYETNVPYLAGLRFHSFTWLLNSRSCDSFKASISMLYTIFLAARSLRSSRNLKNWSKKKSFQAPYTKIFSNFIVLKHRSLITFSLQSISASSPLVLHAVCNFGCTALEASLVPSFHLPTSCIRGATCVEKIHLFLRSSDTNRSSHYHPLKFNVTETSHL